MPERVTETRTHLPCPRCGRSLLPVPAGETMTFHCKSGHELPVLDLLTAQSASLRSGLEILLAEWGGQHRALIGIVEDAGRNGYLNIAEIFLRHAGSLESRIDFLKSALSKSDSSRLLAIPESVKSSPSCD